jgi:hypothetical protein
MTVTTVLWVLFGVCLTCLLALIYWSLLEILHLLRLLVRVMLAETQESYGPSLARPPAAGYRTPGTDPAGLN